MKEYRPSSCEVVPHGDGVRIIFRTYKRFSLIVNLSVYDAEHLARQVVRSVKSRRDTAQRVIEAIHEESS